MSFTDQKPFIATEEQCKAPWAAVKGGKKFRCYLCGHRFVVGDTVRWVYGNTPTEGETKAYGNFLTCSNCDNPNVLEDYKRLVQEWEQLIETRFWSFV